MKDASWLRSNISSNFTELCTKHIFIRKGKGVFITYCKHRRVSIKLDASR